MKKYKKRVKKSLLKEPNPSYRLSMKKHLSIYNSFEEAEYCYLASLTGEQHLANAVAWIKRLYAKELKKHPEPGTNFRVK